MNNNKGWIKGIFDGFKSVPWIGDQIFMQRVPKFDPITQKMHHTIEIVDFDFTVKVLGRKLSYNPMREVRGALYAISKGQKMNFLQEYALESVWHEIKHAGAVNWRNQSMVHNTTSVEMIHQFCARRTYGQFIKKLGVDPTHELAVIRHGIGYSRELDNFSLLLKKYNISEEKVFDAFKLKIQAFAYEDIHPMLVEFLKENGVTNPDSFIRKLDKSKKKFSRMLNRAPK